MDTTTSSVFSRFWRLGYYSSFIKKVVTLLCTSLYYNLYITFGNVFIGTTENMRDGEEAQGRKIHSNEAVWEILLNTEPVHLIFKYSVHVVYNVESKVDHYFWNTIYIVTTINEFR